APAHVVERRRHLRGHAGVAVGVPVDECPNAGPPRRLRERGERRPALEARPVGVDEDRVEVVEVPERVVAPGVGLLPEVEHRRPLDQLLAGLDAEADGMVRHPRAFNPSRVLREPVMTTAGTSEGLLAGVRVIESSLLGPGAVGMQLADLGAEVIKVEGPGGDYVRKMAFPIVDGISLLHWHLNRGKQSIVLDLRKPEAVDAYLALLRGADAVIEAMRPGALARRGITWERLQGMTPRFVFCASSGYGLTGPYRDMPSHGIAYDAWGGVARPAFNAEGMPTIPSYTPVGINSGPLYAALGICAAIIRARASGHGCRFGVAQSDAAAAFNWNGIEGNKAYERPEDEVTGNDGDGKGPRRPVGDDSMTESVRYQYYRSRDGMVLFMASEREFWKNFCEGIGRP